eukprot:m.74287 g.74287  ORF g.74287 m.74287 type:complete len:646 (+) comp12453_c0_seq6:53-1990(+)
MPPPRAILPIVSFLNRSGGHLKVYGNKIGVALVLPSSTMAAPTQEERISNFFKHFDNSWLRMLTPDPEQQEHAPNKTSREVKSGHYVEVAPTALETPIMRLHSTSMAAELGLEEEDFRTDTLLRYFSGDLGFSSGLKSWATPYALSIYGEKMFRNCPFGNGNGYGDGRAISIGEFVSDTGKRWELQLKGAGKTPFCRGADGRAVLRSSIREFLASEAMHSLGVSTTRAISLVVSQTETVQRPWYSNRNKGQPDINIDDPRLENIPMQLRQMFIEQLANQFRDPDVMQAEPCAISTRVAPSFMRIGHIEIHGRRAKSNPTVENKEQLARIIKHAIFREFPSIDDFSDIEKDLSQEHILQFLEKVSEGICKLTSDWIRVGFVQGNFNSDNCLVAGRTMDYGPFGFLEKYEPLWNMWIGGGEHFGFSNQPTAGAKNFGSLVEAVSPLLEGDFLQTAKKLQDSHEEKAHVAVQVVWAKKLGFSVWTSEADATFRKLFALMRSSQVDFTIMFRELSGLLLSAEKNSALREGHIPPSFSQCFYEQPDEKTLGEWVQCLSEWINIVEGQAKENELSVSDVASIMRKVSPKYIPREWMLVQAYKSAYEGDFTLVKELHTLFQNPYDEQLEMEEKYYRKALPTAFTEGGTAFMS